jgi:hypothetical protein
LAHQVFAPNTSRSLEAVKPLVTAQLIGGLGHMAVSSHSTGPHAIDAASRRSGEKDASPAVIADAGAVLHALCGAVL